VAGGPLNRPIVEAFDALSPQLQTAARYMLDRPDDVALLSMREQARRAGVPPATMTRLAKRLGLEGYDEVRALYAGAVRDGTLGFAGKAGVQVEAQKLRGERALAADMALTLSRQIARLAETPTLDRLADAAGRLHQARRIYCLGLRSCHGIAWHFHYMLSLLGDKAVMLDDAGGIGLDAIRDAGKHDVVLAASVEPYARATIEGARYVAQQGVPVVALTDSEVSPLAQIAVAVIPAATESPSFFHTMTPLLAVAEILAALVAGRSGQKALDALTRTEAQLAAFGVHLPRRGAKEKS
jgi:DNA-binding MurR/RpiR family transcriptional regulator